MTTLDEPLVRRYLLGQIPEDEATAFEREYFASGEVLERVWGAENDLIDAYVAGELGPADRSAFEGHYLSSPAHRDRVASARALAAAGRGPALRPVSRRAAQRFTPWLALAAGLLLALTAWWWNSRPAPPAGTIAEVTQPTRSPIAPSSPGSRVVLEPADGPPTPSPASRRTIVAAFALSPILLRGSQQTPELRLPADTDEVALTLDGALPDGVAPGQRLTFAVGTVEGAPVARGRMRPGPTGLGIAHVPAARIPPGDYILSVFPPEPGNQDAPLRQYFFRVRPR